jgi:hypothetical protein
MNASSTPAGRKPLDRQTAWGFLTTNLALPGFGSLLGQRRIGYLQAAVSVSGLVLTLTFGTRFVIWYFTNLKTINDTQGDPLSLLGETLIQVRWALLGMALFGLALLWALTTSLSLLREAKRLEGRGGASQPPVLKGPPDAATNANGAVR